MEVIKIISAIGVPLAGGMLSRADCAGCAAAIFAKTCN